MALWDKLTGRERPDDGTPEQPVEQLRQALVATAGPGAPWSLEPGERDGVDLVVRWRVNEPTFRELVLTLRDRSHLIVLELQFDEANHEVRVLEHAVTVTERRGAFELSYERDSRRGIVREKTWDKTVGGDTVSTFDDDDLKAPLREAALAAGWGWHPVTDL